MGQIIIKGLDQIGSIIEGEKFLLVRDSSYDYLNVRQLFDDIPHVEFSDFTPNPLYEQVCKGVKLFNEERCGLIVAIGGGSTIDVAKCIKLYCKMNHEMNYLEQNALDSGITLVAIPTTAGTGSESTCHAVIYYGGSKQSISHASILPDYAILEPSLLKTLPLYQKKCTMLDALCQAIESWWSVKSTDESKAYSRKAILAIKANWELYLFENVESAAQNIMEAANYAGRAINLTATTAAHAMSYKITSLYNFPHGHAVAVCMAEVWEYMLGHPEACIDERGIMYFKETLSQIGEVVDLCYYRAMLDKMEMRYPKASDKAAELEILVQSVNPIRLKNNPLFFSSDVLKNMYERILK